MAEVLKMHGESAVMQDERHRIAIINVLKYGLREFYRNDADLLFGKIERGKDVNECAMVGCVYRYMFIKLAESDCPWRHIDIEYDRMEIDQAEYEKSIIVCENCPNPDVNGGYGNCVDYAKLIKKTVEGHCSKAGYEGIRPDMIVHNRKSSQNGLVVEFKKSSKDSRYDEVKVKYATCDHSPLHYMVGAVVRLLRNKAKVQLYAHGKTDGEEFEIDASPDLPIAKSVAENLTRRRGK